MPDARRELVTEDIRPDVEAMPSGNGEADEERPHDGITHEFLDVVVAVPGQGSANGLEEHEQHCGAEEHSAKVQDDVVLEPLPPSYRKESPRRRIRRGGASLISRHG